MLEPWITPSLFAQFINSSTPAEDEYTFTAVLGKAEAASQLTAHWDTWLQRSDLATLAAAGITHVRIPVGYWIVSIESFEPFVDGGWAYLERAMHWCAELGIKVLIDMHGLPGSQNGPTEVSEENFSGRTSHERGATSTMVSPEATSWRRVLRTSGWSVHCGIVRNCSRPACGWALGCGCCMMRELLG